MKNITNQPVKRSLLALCTAALLAAPAGSHAEWVVQPKHYGGSLDIGQVKEGYSTDQLQNYPITRTAVHLGVSAVNDDKLELRLTLGGMYWFAASTGSGAEYRLIKYGGGLGEAQAIYHFGGQATPHSRLQVGFFPVKYGDSHNLGEYLFRSGTYPANLVTGGWSYLQSASYGALGVRYILPTFSEKVTHEFTLFSDRDWEPLHDLSPGYMVTARPNSFLEIGGGMVWSHALPARPSRVSPKVFANAYSKTTGMPLAGLDTTGVTVIPLETDTLYVWGACLDPDPAGQAACNDPDNARARQTIADWQDCQAGDCSDIGYYTFSGFKAMLRASLDLGMLIGSPRIAPGEFKLYAEGALLGIENQPYFYDDRMARMPIMGGVNLPTFGILDRLSAEVEYRKTRFPNTIYGVQQGNPVPVASTASSRGGYQYLNAEDEFPWKWSFYARKSVLQGVNLHAQVAADHMRHPDFWGVMSDEPVTREKKDWYYVFRVDFNL